MSTAQPQLAYPPGALLRAVDICRDKKRGYGGILPIHVTTWHAWIKSGRVPPGHRLPGGVPVWRIEDVLALAEPERVAA